MDNAFKSAVERVSTPVYLSTKGEVIDYYKDKYGEKKWTHAIASDLYGTVKNRKGEDVSIKNIQRRFQAERLAKEGRSSQQYKQLGEKLPSTGRKPTQDSVNFTVTGNFPNGRGGTRKRTIGTQEKITLSGQELYNFVNNPSLEPLWHEYFGEEFDIEGEYGGVEDAVVGVA